MKNENSGAAILAGCLGMLILFPILFALGCLINGYVISELWRLFLVPLGVVAISNWHALGIATLIAYVVPFTDTTWLAKKDDYSAKLDAVTKILFHLVFKPSIALGMAYLISWLMRTY